MYRVSTWTSPAATHLALQLGLNAAPSCLRRRPATRRDLDQLLALKFVRALGKSCFLVAGIAPWVQVGASENCEREIGQLWRARLCKIS